ncbi:MAG: AbrB/MazE/SpoVT family DNA-binding domain-containing protein [Defluviitaleaceae bacterium]|nr:AbrB/MazE/SpoVT family DNA-binding domain-containing protein [Defluviitaleaceae bacterium]
MERYSAKTIDKRNRIVLHKELRDKLQLGICADIRLMPMGNVVILQRANSYEGGDVTIVDELGRIILPNELVEYMDWKEADRISIYYVDDSMLILRQA